VNGYSLLQVKVMGIEAKPYKVDLCTDAGLQCPIKAGTPQVAKVTYKIPSYAPSTTVEAHITAVDTKEASLGCVDANVEIINVKKADAPKTPTPALRA